MRYGLLSRYREYLKKIYTEETARVYAKRLAFLLDGQYLINSACDIDFKKVIDRFETIKHKNYFSQCKNALLHFCEFQNTSLNKEYLNKIMELEHSTKKKYRKLKTIDFKSISQAINHLKNDKLKLSYLTMLATGLRVSEISQIMGENCVVDNSQLTFKFIGKGGKKEKVVLTKDDNIRLFENLVEHINNTKIDKKLFYSSTYLQEKANELGFRCHDLRRIFAQLEYKKSKSKEKVMKKLRHKNLKTTNKYLSWRIKF